MELFSVKDAIDEAVVKSRKLREGIIRGYWYDIVGKLSSKSEPLWIKGDTLYVLVEDSVYLHHMSMKKREYLEKINSLLSSNYVKDIMFKVSKLHGYDYEKVKKDIKGKKTPFKTQMKELSLNEKVELLKAKSKEREKKLKEDGFVKCQKCGTMFLGESEFCKPCSLKKESLDKVLEDKNDNK